MAATDALALKKGPVTTIETETTTIEVVTTEALQNQEDDQVVSLEGQNGPSRPDCMTAPVKVEVEDGDGNANMPPLFDLEVLMNAIGDRLFERYTIWDLMLCKARLVSRNPDYGAVPVLIDDLERILLEMKILIESCMQWLPQKPGRRKKHLDPEEYYMSDLVSTALCIDTGLWKKKSADEIEYDCPLELSKLFPTVGTESGMSSTSANLAKKVKIEDDLDDGARETIWDDPDYQMEKRAGKKGGKRRGRPRKLKTEPLEVDENNPVLNKAGVPKKMRLKYKMTEERQYLCRYPDCPDPADQIFKNRAEFENHFLGVHATDVHRVIPCLLEEELDCKMKFALTSERNAHMDANHERLHGCKLCDRKFFRLYDVGEHVKRSHEVNDAELKGGMGEGEDFDPACVCSRCGKKFASRTYVDNHERTCDGLFVRQPKFTLSKVNNMYFCQEHQCPVKSAFESEYALRMHFYDDHLREEEKIFVCEFCNQHFALRTLLNKHVNAAHNKNHQCDFCGKRFGAKDKLKSHTYTHTGEKPFHCDKCDYRTAKKYNLDQHKQSKHQDFGVKSHYCELCGKGFVTQGRVRQHKKVIHKEGRPLSMARKKAIKKSVPQPMASGSVIEVGERAPSQPQQQQDVIHQVAVNEEQDAAVEYITTELTDQSGVIVGLRY